MSTMPASNRTNNLLIARTRLSDFVTRKAQHVTRITGVNYEECDNAPDSFDTVKECFNAALRNVQPYKVFKGASDNTIYLKPHHNWAFRFWHDYLHFVRDLDFSTEHEIRVGQIQMAEVAQEFGLGSLEYLLMEIDTVKQVEHFAHTGQFVENQLEFALEHLEID